MTPLPSTQHPRFAGLVARLAYALASAAEATTELHLLRTHAEQVIGALFDPTVGLTPFVMSFIHPEPALMRPALLGSTLHLDAAVLDLDTTALVAVLERTRAALLDPAGAIPPRFVCPTCGAPLQYIRWLSQTWTVDPTTGRLGTAQPLFVDDVELRCSAYGFDHAAAVRQIDRMAITDPANHAVRLCPSDGLPLEETGMVGLRHADVWDAELTRYRCQAPGTAAHLVFVADADTTAAIDKTEAVAADERCSGCGALLNDGEGWDGLCGTCADQAAAAPPEVLP